MPTGEFSFKPGLVDGLDWAFYFDSDEGALVSIDGEHIGELSGADLRQLMADSPRDAGLQADAIVRKLEGASHFPKGVDAFPVRQTLNALVAAWLGDTVGLRLHLMACVNICDKDEAAKRATHQCAQATFVWKAQKGRMPTSGESCPRRRKGLQPEGLLSYPH